MLETQRFHVKWSHNFTSRNIGGIYNLRFLQCQMCPVIKISTILSSLNQGLNYSASLHITTMCSLCIQLVTSTNRGRGGVVVTPLAEHPSYVRAVFAAIIAVRAVVGSTPASTSKVNCFFGHFWFCHTDSAQLNKPRQLDYPFNTVNSHATHSLPSTFPMFSIWKCGLFRKSHQYGNLTGAVDIALDQRANVYPDWDLGEAEAGLVSPVGFAQQQLRHWS